ncbi:DUF1990 domain-containing protein [Nocardioides sp.]|uniref:DUF1990 family protein n=1 Tax=Nocardioides sp. TaxID=35761 RepID=UPI002CCE5D85|nr:DUF1990 domain-containing protein [Nocardioides sp.]HSX67465.1 DUF1990 domain-containing protein [Nocardioides sp.]
MVTLLDPVDVERLSREPFTHDAVGATRGAMPAGHRHLDHTRTIRGRGFDEAAELLMSWRLHEWSGLSVVASSRGVEAGGVVVLGLGAGRARLRIPCRVAYVIDEADRRGFAYGTLPGHPEVGEELFLLERRPGAAADLTVRAFSRPATWLARAGGPVSRYVQSWMTDRYLRALDR